ncbi:hypothetical protein ACE21V_002104 [Salmonella enterica]
MFNDLNYFAAYFVWVFPLFTILAVIFRRDRWEFMPKYQWGILFVVSVAIAGVTTISNLKAIDNDLLSRAQEYSGCTELSRGSSGNSPVSRVRLDCGGKTYLVPQQYYDDIIDAANRHAAK